MNTIIALSLVALVLLLFYRFVERRHKILLAKIIGVLLGTGVLGVASLFAYAQLGEHQDRLRRESVNVTFVPDSQMVYGRDDPRLPRLFADTVNEASFLICNNSTDTLTNLQFWPKTVDYERSTEHQLRIGTGVYTPGEFTSDFIVDPRECITLTWSGSFEIRDTVIARLISPTFNTR